MNDFKEERRTREGKEERKSERGRGKVLDETKQPKDTSRKLQLNKKESYDINRRKRKAEEDLRSAIKSGDLQQQLTDK